jgi:hypothetical protein
VGVVKADQALPIRIVERERIAQAVRPLRRGFAPFDLEFQPVPLIQQMSAPVKSQQKFEGMFIASAYLSYHDMITTWRQPGCPEGFVEPAKVSAARLLEPGCERAACSPCRAIRRFSPHGACRCWVLASAASRELITFSPKGWPYRIGENFGFRLIPKALVVYGYRKTLLLDSLDSKIQERIKSYFQRLIIFIMRFSGTPVRFSGKIGPLL